MRKRLYILIRNDKAWRLQVRSLFSQLMDISDKYGLLKGKSGHTKDLFAHFIASFEQTGPITVHEAKTMIGVANSHKRIAWITMAGRNYIHVVFPFTEPYEDNLCFMKIARVPGKTRQFNHHFRMFMKEDVNEEVLRFMKMAYAS